MNKNQETENRQKILNLILGAIKKDTSIRSFKYDASYIKTSIEIQKQNSSIEVSLNEEDFYEGVSLIVFFLNVEGIGSRENRLIVSALKFALSNGFKISHSYGKFLVLKNPKNEILQLFLPLDEKEVGFLCRLEVFFYNVIYNA